MMQDSNRRLGLLLILVGISLVMICLTIENNRGRSISSYRSFASLKELTPKELKAFSHLSIEIRKRVQARKDGLDTLKKEVQNLKNDSLGSLDRSEIRRSYSQLNNLKLERRELARQMQLTSNSLKRVQFVGLQEEEKREALEQKRKTLTFIEGMQGSLEDLESELNSIKRQLGKTERAYYSQKMEEAEAYFEDCVYCHPASLGMNDPMYKMRMYQVLEQQRGIFDSILPGSMQNPFAQGLYTDPLMQQTYLLKPFGHRAYASYLPIQKNYSQEIFHSLVNPTNAPLELPGTAPNSFDNGFGFNRPNELQQKFFNESFDFGRRMHTKTVRPFAGFAL